MDDFESVNYDDLHSDTQPVLYGDLHPDPEPNFETNQPAGDYRIRV